MPIDAHTLAQHPWMKYINQEELLKPEPYDGYPRHKLREMLIQKDEFIKDTMDNIEDHPDYEDIVGGFEIQLQEYKKEAVKELNEEIRDLQARFKRLEEKNSSLEKKVNSTKRVAKSVNTKLQKQIQTLNNEIGELKNQTIHGEATIHSWDRKNKQQLEQIDFHQQEIVKLKAELEKVKREKEENGEYWHGQFSKLEAEVKASQEVSRFATIRCNELEKMEKEIDKVCSRIQIAPEDAVDWFPELPNHDKDKIKQQKQLIDYYELREDYFMKFLEGWESGCHEWREFCEARAHKTGNEEHVGILFDD